MSRKRLKALIMDEKVAVMQEYDKNTEDSDNFGYVIIVATS